MTTQENCKEDIIGSFRCENDNENGDDFDRGKV